MMCIKNNSIERFSNRVENYIKYRPHYPKEIIDILANKINLKVTDKIADIGSGTGISAINFLENGNTVIGVEPNDEMRKASEKLLANFKKFSVIKGTSDNTNLEKNTIDLIIVGQAFHWFDYKNTKIEFQKILKKDAYVVLIWNEKVMGIKDTFMYEYGKILLKYGTDYEKVTYSNLSEEIIKEFFNNQFKVETLSNFQYFDFDALKGRLLSSSYVPLEGESYNNMLLDLKTNFDKYKKEGKVNFEYETKIYYGKIS
ncbi:MAG: class I SAM-dependent methyltransferase [Candidatus Sericytochromatia bacterium]